MPAMQGLLNLSFELEDFIAWLETEVKPKMGSTGFRPDGFVLHNTATRAASWPGHDAHQNLLTPAQRIANMSVDWVSRGMSRAPHILATMKNDVIKKNMFHVMTPLWMEGQHSKMWNKSKWGLEMFADFDLDECPEHFVTFVGQGMRGCYNMISKTANDERFKLHKEDLISKHFGCPGKNAMPKQRWINAINTPAAHEVLIEVPHAHPVPAAASPWIEEREGFVAHAYVDGHAADGSPLYAIGNGTQIYPDGTRVQKDDVCTKEQAKVWRDFRISSDWAHIQQLVTVHLTDGQATVLLSWCYQFNVAKFTTTTMFKKLNAGDYEGAALSLMQWNKTTVNGVLVENAGLVKRRKMEFEIWHGRDPHGLIIAPAKPVLSPAKPLPTIPAPVTHNPAPMAPHIPIKPPDKVLDAMPLWGTFVVWLINLFKKA